MTTHLWVSGLALLLSVSACTKNEFAPNEPEIQMAANNPNSANNCNAVEFLEVFKKTYDPETGLLKSITSPGWSGGAIEEYYTYDVLWLPGKVIFHQAGSETDYALAVYLNSAGQAVKTKVGNQSAAPFLNSSLSYSGKKLSKIKMQFADGLEWKFKYDHKGNCVRIDKINGGQDGGRVLYEYDLTRKAKSQYYEGEAKGWSDNTYGLLSYAGLLPSTMPVNLRTRATVIWGEDYQASDVLFSHHKLDNKKNLYAYRVRSVCCASEYWTEQITWACSTRGMSLQ